MHKCGTPTDHVSPRKGETPMSTTLAELIEGITGRINTHLATSGSDTSQARALLADFGRVSHLDHQARVPMSDGLQRQGDVLVVPASMVTDYQGPDCTDGNRVPLGGVPVVRGEAGGNTHALHGDGTVFFETREPVIDRDTRKLAIGVLDVPEGATAYLFHPEHGALGLLPGCYEVRRQSEGFGAELALVAD